MRRKTNRFTDIHCHILPGLDDGSRDFAMSMDMLRMEARDGVDSIILTPHFKPGDHNASPETIVVQTAKLQDMVDEMGLGIDLYTGNEIFYFDDVPQLLAHNDICTLADTRYVLLEFNPLDTGNRIRSALYEVQAAGFIPVIAHVERYMCMTERPELVEEISRMGVLIQVNADAVTGRNGGEWKRFTRKLIRDGLVDLVASDAHDTSLRAPRLAECAAKISGKFGERCARRLLDGNAQRILREAAEESDIV